MTPHASDNATQNGRGFDLWLIATTGLCGALVMVIEVLGSRIIGPFFWVSLFVWTALITVTLLSLAAGYALGGYWADRHPSPDWLYGLIIVAGILTGLIPFLKAWVIQATIPLGLRMGALVSSTLLFAPTLVLLGCVSPYVVRIAAREFGRIGRTVGVLYAVSTAGSFVGTAATGFFVIAYIGVSKAFLLCGVALCAIGAVYFVVFRHRVVVLAVFLPFLLSPSPLSREAILEDGTRARLIDHADSFYGSVKVVDYQGARGGIRELIINGLVQSGVDLATGQSIYEYSYLLQHLPIAVKPDAKSALLVGLGAGVVARWYAERGIDMDAVDIDPTVVAMAEKNFGLRLPRPVVVEDARYFIAQPGQIYDIVLMDAFTGDSSPSHLLSTEALGQVKARMAPDGVLALNIIGDLRPGSHFLPVVARTLQEHFSEIVMFPMFDTSLAGGTGGNVVLLARNGDLTSAAGADFSQVHAMARPGVEMAMRLAQPLRLKGGAVLTDDFNPLDVLDIELHEQVRRTIMQTTPANILLYG